MIRVAIRKLLAVGLITGMAGLGAASADELMPVNVGPRVRVTAPTVSGKRLIGTLLAIDETTLTLRPQKGGDVLEVPRSAITRMELSRRPSRKGKGAGIGALVGLGAALAIGFASGEDCSSLPKGGGLEETLRRNLCIDKGQMAAVMSVLTVPAGVLIGIGAAGGEKWSRTAPDRFQVAVAPVRTGGLGAALSVRF